MKYVNELSTYQKKEKNTFNVMHALLNSNVGFQILLPIVISLTLGIVFDNLLNIKPVLTVIFLFLGVGASFYAIYTIIEREKNASRKY